MGSCGSGIYHCYWLNLQYMQSNQNTQKVKDFIKETDHLFWYMPKDKVENISMRYWLSLF